MAQNEENMKYVDDFNIAMLSMYNDPTWLEKMKVIQGALAYQGFDAKKCIAAFTETYNTAKETSGGKAMLRFGGVKRGILCATYNEELNFWIFFYVIRGSNITKACKEMSPEDRTYAKAKQNLMKIQDRAGPNATSSTVTLSRLANCYPHLVLAHRKMLPSAERSSSPWSSLKWAQVSQIGCFSKVDVAFWDIAFCVNYYNDISHNKEKADIIQVTKYLKLAAGHNATTDNLKKLLASPRIGLYSFEQHAVSAEVTILRAEVKAWALKMGIDIPECPAL